MTLSLSNINFFSSLPDGRQDADPAAGELCAGDAETGALPRQVAHLPLEGGGRLPPPGMPIRLSQDLPHPPQGARINCITHLSHPCPYFSTP